MTILKELPALVVLERIPVPALAIVQDGTILFANTAFADMLGYPAETVQSLEFSQIFHKAPAADSVMSAVHALSNMVVELAHSDGSTVQALMSRSVLARSDDPIALVTFQDLTEHLWVNGP
jgi:PAS domain S-box-containing protein